jgi:6-phosphogluconolactonase (cycloisomerase 2 family)
MRSRSLALLLLALLAVAAAVTPAGARADLLGPSDVARTGGQPIALAFSPDGKLIATANRLDGSISMFSVTGKGDLTKVPRSPFRTFDDPESVAFSPNGKLLATANKRDDAVTLYSVGADGVLQRAPGSPVVVDGAAPTSVAFSPDGRLLASANGNGSLSVFSVDGDGGLVEVQGSPFATQANSPSIAFRPDGRALALVDRGASDLLIFQVASSGAMTRTSSTPLDKTRFPTSVAFSPDGQLIATANTTPVSVSMFSMPLSSSVPEEVEGSPYYNGENPNGGDLVGLTSVSFSPDGKLLGATTAFADDFPMWDQVTLFSVGPRGKLTKTGTNLQLDGDLVSASVAAISPAGGVLAAVNMPGNSLSTFDLTGLSRALGGAPTRARRNRFVLSRVRTRTDGRVSLRVRVPRPGGVRVLATARKEGAMRTARDRFVFARKHVRISRRGTVAITVRPNRRGRRLLARHRSPVRIRLWVTHKPRRGAQRTIGRHVTHPGAPRSGKAESVVATSGRRSLLRRSGTAASALLSGGPS